MNLETLFYNHCKNGDYEKMKKTLPISDGSSQTYLTLNTGFRWACLYGHLPIVSYLLTSDDLPQKALIHSNNDSAINNAVKNGHIEVIDYLLFSPELINHIDLNKNILSCFEQAIVSQQRNVLEYFIFQLNLVIPETLKTVIDEKISSIEDISWQGTVRNLFNTQTLYNQLQDKIKNKFNNAIIEKLNNSNHTDNLLAKNILNKKKVKI